MKKNFRTLETLGKPVVALPQRRGARRRLGGGADRPLPHRRSTTRRSSSALPEVTLGLIPGATGITKMTRLLGLMGAQPYLLEGKLFGPREALELGLVSTTWWPTPASCAPRRWPGSPPIRDATQPWDGKDYRMPGGTPRQPEDRRRRWPSRRRMLTQKTRGLYPAPEAIAGGDGRRRAGRLRHRDCASRAATSPS